MRMYLCLGEVNQKIGVIKRGRLQTNNLRHYSDEHEPKVSLVNDHIWQPKPRLRFCPSVRESVRMIGKAGMGNDTDNTPLLSILKK